MHHRPREALVHWPAQRLSPAVPRQTRWRARSDDPLDGLRAAICVRERPGARQESDRCGTRGRAHGRLRQRSGNAEDRGGAWPSNKGEAGRGHGCSAPRRRPVGRRGRARPTWAPSRCRASAAGQRAVEQRVDREFQSRRGAPAVSDGKLDDWLHRRGDAGWRVSGAGTARARRGAWFARK